MKQKLIGILLGVVLVLTLLLQNTDYTTIRFLFWEKHVPTYGLVIIVVVVGFFMGYIAAKMPRRSDS